MNSLRAHDRHAAVLHARARRGTASSPRWLTLGEGYHNFHHRFQADYRNGVRLYHFDPTKWFVWTMSRVGVTRDLRRTPRERIEAARAAVRAKRGAAA